MAGAINVRPFVKADVPSLLGLMRRLAEFENYGAEFRVTEKDLINRGLGPSPQFGALVADEGGAELLGMAVHYVISWTYDLKPTLVLKELFVAESARGRGVGRRLMRAIINEGTRIGAARIHWLVLPDNEPAKSLYRSMGGNKDTKWESWGLVLDVNKSP